MHATGCAIIKSQTGFGTDLHFSNFTYMQYLVIDMSNQVISRMHCLQ